MYLCTRLCRWRCLQTISMPYPISNGPGLEMAIRTAPNNEKLVSNDRKGATWPITFFHMIRFLWNIWNILYTLYHVIRYIYIYSIHTYIVRCYSISHLQQKKHDSRKIFAGRQAEIDTSRENTVNKAPRPYASLFLGGSRCFPYNVHNAIVKMVKRSGGSGFEWCLAYSFRWMTTRGLCHSKVIFEMKMPNFLSFSYLKESKSTQVMVTPTNNTSTIFVRPSCQTNTSVNFIGSSGTIRTALIFGPIWLAFQFGKIGERLYIFVIVVETAVIVRPNYGNEELFDIR